jgi:hypothetical protein
MALVSKIEESQKEGKGVHRPTKCEYLTVDGPGNSKVLQLDTYGSDEREHPEKVSQSIQFDKQGATILLAILRATFPELR